MFGFGFIGKVKDVLVQEFSYQTGGMQTDVLKQITKTAKMYGANEYDAAIMFMLVQMNALYGSDKRTQDFINLHVGNIRRILHRASNSPADIEDQITEVQSSHGISTSQKPASKNLSFDSWLKEFKLGCQDVNKGLSIDQNGGSLVDFMDHTPLKQAHRDGVEARELGRNFGATFDPKKFGN